MKINLTILFKKYPFIIGGVILSFISCMLAVSLFQVLIEKNNKIVFLHDNLNLYQKNANDCQGIEQDNKIAEELVESARKKLLLSEDTTTVFSFFLDLEKQTGVSMKDPVLLGFLPVLKSESPKTQKMETFIHTKIARYQVTVSGYLENVLNYVQLLNCMESNSKTDFFSRCAELNIQKDNTSQEPNKVVADITIYILGRES